MTSRILMSSICTLALLGCATTNIDPTPTPITINFASRSITDLNALQNIKPGSFYQVKIDNVNLNLYKIKLGNKDSSSSKPLSFPTFTTLPIESLQKTIGALSSLGGAVSAVRADAVPLSKMMIKDAGNKMLLEGDAFHEEYSKSLKRIVKSEGKDESKVVEADEVRGLLRGTETTLKDSLKALNTYKRKIDSVLYLSNQSILNTQLESARSIFGGGISPQDLVREVTAYRLKLDNLSKGIKTASEQYNAARSNYEEIIEGKPEYKDLDAQLKKAFADFEPAIGAVKEPINATNAAKIFASVASTVNNNTNSYISLPLQFTKEEATIDIEITPRSETSMLQSYRTSLAFPTETMDSFWGLSSGFYISSPANEAYSTQTNIGADTTYTLINEEPGKFEIGFNTMMRYGRRIKNKSNTYWQVGIGPGVSVSDKVRPRMLLGTGFAFGEKHAFLVDGGAIIGYYDVKSRVYNTETSYALQPTNATTSKLKTGFYFSVSYLFLK